MGQKGRTAARKRTIRRALQREQRTTTRPQSPTGIASEKVGMARVGEDGGFEELDGLRVQMDTDEERLAKTMSDFDMLCAHRDAVARACQVLEEEERVQLRRLERLDLLVQLRALQHSQPWAARQQAVVDRNRNPAKQHGEDAPLPAHGARTRTLPASVSDDSSNKRAVDAGGHVARAAGQGADTRQASGHATASSHRDQPAVCAMQAQQQMPVDRLHPATGEPEEQHKKGQQQSLTEERTRHTNEGQGGTLAPAACSAATLSCIQEACNASQRSAPGTTNDATTTQGEAAPVEPQRAAKRAKINPMRFVCKFQLHGQCRDPSCPDMHLDSPPKVCQATAADAVSGEGKLRAVEESDTQSRGLVSGADAPAERVGECGEMEAEESAGTSEPQRKRAAGGRVSDELGKMWPDFVAFSPLSADLEGRSLSSDTPSALQPGLPPGSVAIAGLAAVETRGACAALAQRHMEQDQAAEEADVSRLEEQWRATTEERYFGAMAQVSAARRKSSQEPGNIIAWLRLAQLLLQGGGGEGRASVSQDLALNALSNGLDANVCSLDLWLAYLEVLRRKDGDEAAEMLEVAVQKVPLALSLWHRLASAQPSVQMRLGVWQRAVESAAAMLVPDKQLVDMGVGLASGWRQALAMWLQAQIAGAATLTLALRPAEASSLLARAASRLPLVLGIHFDPCAWEGDGDGKHAVESAEEGARGSIGEREWSPEEVEREADKWKVALPVIETLCLLSVQVVSAGAMLHSSTCPSVLQGRTPSTRFCGAGAGAELIVAAAAHSAHVNIHAPSARQSPPWTYAAVCLSSLTPIPDNSEDNGARQQSVGEDNAAAIEAVEHASYLWRRCVASARRVGAGCDESGVSPVLAEHYVTLMRRASPFRGACTARQRILACAPLGFARTPAPGFSLGAAASTASADAARPGIQQSADAARPGVQQSQRTARSVGSWFPDAAELVGPLGKVKATSCNACHKVGHDKFECPAFFFKTFNQAMPGHSQDGLKLPNYWHDNNPQNGPAGWVAEGWIQQSWLTSQTLAGRESLKPTGLGTDAWRAWANRGGGGEQEAQKQDSGTAIKQLPCQGCQRIFGSAQGLASHLADSHRCPSSSNYHRAGGGAPAAASGGFGGFGSSATAPLTFGAGGGTLCPPQDGQYVDAPTAHDDARVLVALVRDAVLLHALPPSAPDSKGQEDAEGWELEKEKEGQDLQARNEARGLTSLQRLARAIFDRKLNRLNENLHKFLYIHVHRHQTQVVYENSQQLKHAAQTAELTYWTSRLALIASSSFADKPSSSSASERAVCCEVQKSLDAIRRGLAHVQTLLAPAGASGAGQHSTGTEMGCGGSRVQGQEPGPGVTADIIAALSCLLCQNAGTAEPIKSGKEDGDGGKQEHETEEVLCADAAEEAMWWWWSRNFVWAMLLEWRIAPLPGAPRRNLHDMSAEDADRLLAKCLDAVRKMEESGQACCARCGDDVAGGPTAACYHLEAIAQQNGSVVLKRLCQSSLLRLARAAICVEWQHLLLRTSISRVHTRDMASGTGCNLAKSAFLEILGQVKTAALIAKLRSPQHSGQHKELGVGGSAGGDNKMSWRQWRRYMTIAGAWEAVLSGDEADAAQGIAPHAVHTPGLLHLLFHEATQSGHSAAVASMARALIDAAQDAVNGQDGMRRSLAIAAAAFLVRLGAVERGAATKMRMLTNEDVDRVLGLVEWLEGAEPVLCASHTFWLLKLKLANLAKHARPGQQQLEGSRSQVQEQAEEENEAMLEQACNALPESARLVHERLRLLAPQPVRAAALRKSARKLGLNV